MKERRKFSRVEYQHPIELKTKKGELIVADVENISFTGSCITITSDAKLAVGDVVVFSVPLSQEDDIVINGVAEVLWEKGTTYGLAYTGMNFDSFAGLRKLMEQELSDETKFVDDLRQYIRTLQH